MKTVEQYLEEIFDINDNCQVRNKIICNDGFSISVQGGTSIHYCIPKKHYFLNHNNLDTELEKFVYPLVLNDFIIDCERAKIELEM